MTTEEYELKIAELETELSIIKANRLANRAITHFYIECSIALVGNKVPLAKFLKPTEDGAEDYYTVDEYCEAFGRAYKVNADKTRILFPFDFSDLYNDIKAIKELLQSEPYGLVLGGKDFSVTGDNLFWVLNYAEEQEFSRVNPKWVAEEVI